MLNKEQNEKMPLFLEEAIALANEKMNAGEGGPFGAVIVKNNQVVGRGWNRVTSKKDPTAHAEIEAIRRACKTLDTFSLEGCEIYSSCEPCPMCLAAIYWARLDALIFAATREDAADAGFDDDVLYQQVALLPEQRSLLSKNVGRKQAQEVFKRWKEKEDKMMY